MLGKVQGVPVLGERNAEDEVYHLPAATLHLRNRRIRMWMQERGVLCVQSHLGEHTRAVGKRVTNRGAELPEDLAQCLFEFIVYHNVLIDAKVRRG